MAKYIVVHGIKIATEFQPETFGRLTTIGPRFIVGKNAYQVCECICGKVHIAQAHALRYRGTGSCGCATRDATIKRSTKHGECRRGKLTREYRGWLAMMERCHNESHKNFQDYAGRGICVCDRWQESNGLGYLNFLADMGRKPSPKHSLDRIDVNGNYCPENCRWATVVQQMRNMRTNHKVTAFGKTQCVTAWSEETGIPDTAIRARLKRGWPIDKALTTPVKPRKPSRRS